MHEMYEIPDLNAYADAMEDMNDGKEESPSPDDDGEDDFMFIDDSSSNRRPAAGRRPSRVKTDSTPMRKSLSMARLPSEVDRQKKSFFSLLAMAPDIHSAIEEETEEEEDEEVANDAIDLRDVCLDKRVYKGRPLDVRPTKKNDRPDLTNSANRRPSRRALHVGPLKSSLKSSLKTAKTSQSSIASNCSDESSSKLSNSMKRNVSFSNLEIRSYDVTLGDTPTLSGPPISLDWKYDPQATQVHDIENYEQLRSATAENPTPANPRRSGEELFIPALSRQYLLMRDAGFSRMQIKNATEEAQRTAKERQKGAKRSVRLDEMLEKANGRFRTWQKKNKS